MSSNRPPVPGSELWGPVFLTQGDVVRRRQAREKAARQREAPTVPRKVWRDPQIAKAAWLSGAGFTNAAIARMLGSTEQRIGAMLRRLGLRSRNTDGNRLLSQMVPQHTFAFIAAAARDTGLGVGPYVVAAALGQALHGQSDVLEAVRQVVPGAEPPEVAVDPGPLLGDPDLPPDQAAMIDESVRRLYNRPRPPGPKRRGARGPK